VIALVHDVVVTVGLFSLLGLELLAVMLAGVALVGWTIRPLSLEN
jgi:preprotein translocase subunit SecF